MTAFVGECSWTLSSLLSSVNRWRRLLHSVRYRNAALSLNRCSETQRDLTAVAWYSQVNSAVPIRCNTCIQIEHLQRNSPLIAMNS
jgi:hypothetical protein